MKFEPPIKHDQFAETIRTVYGLDVEALTFVPVGYVAVAYSLRCVGGARYFLKLWPKTRAGRSGIARLEAYLPLTRAMDERRLVPRIPYPLLTRDGSLWSTFSGDPFAIFPFLPGSSPPAWPRWPVAVWEELARALAVVHRATPALADVLPPRESFDVAFEADLRSGLEAIERIGPEARPGLIALRALVLPRLDDISVQLARLHHLQRTVRQLSDPLVLCHTDMGGDNLLADASGLLYVLDWEGATVAPPEHDLQCAVDGGSVQRFLEVYQESGGAATLHLDHFAFYLLRRYLEDMSARLLSLLEENTSAEEDKELLHGMEAWGFSQWDALDERLERIAAALT